MLAELVMDGDRFSSKKKLLESMVHAVVTRWKEACLSCEPVDAKTWWKQEEEGLWQCKMDRICWKLAELLLPVIVAVYRWSDIDVNRKVKAGEEMGIAKSVG